MAEAHSAKGRTDLRIDFCNRRIALELKYAPCSANCAELLKSAVSRMKNNNYQDVLPKKAETVCIALSLTARKENFHAGRKYRLTQNLSTRQPFMRKAPGNLIWMQEIAMRAGLFAFGDDYKCRPFEKDVKGFRKSGQNSGVI